MAVADAPREVHSDPEVLERICALHGVLYEGGGISDDDARFVSDWIVGLYDESEQTRPVIGEVLMAMFLSRYVRDGRPGPGYAL